MKIKEKLKGEEWLMDIAARAWLTTRVPKELRRYKTDEKFVRLGLFCRKLQGALGNKPFGLTSRTTANVLGVSEDIAKEYMEKLLNDGLLVLVSKGGFFKGKRYFNKYRYCSQSRRKRKKIEEV